MTEGDVMAERKKTRTGPGPTPTPRAAGDDAAAAGMPLVAGSAAANTIDTELNITRDLIAQRTQVPGTPLPISKGGTGAGTADAARTNLDVVQRRYVVRATTNEVFMAWGGGRLQVTVDTSKVGALAYITDVATLTERLAALHEKLEKAEARITELEAKGAG